MKPKAVNAVVSAHHHNGVPAPGHEIPSVDSVTVKAPEIDWLDKIGIDFSHNTIAVTVQFPDPHNDQVWASVRLKVDRDGSVSLTT